MAYSQFSDRDRRLLLACIKAIALGPFIDDTELEVISGWSRADWVRIASHGPQFDVADPNLHRAIGQALNNLIGVPHGLDNELPNWIPCLREELEDLHRRWSGSLPRPAYTALDVIGPACFDGRFYRVISYSTRTGSGLCSEIWTGTRWSAAEEGPGCRKIMEAAIVSIQELHNAGVNNEPLPADYDPLSN